MAAYYNEIDPFAADWLENLIKEGLIPDGKVDRRSIVEVTPADIRGFTQQHFFAGIGGWALALRLAGWPDDREVGTGSCPCQPYSAAGKQEGDDDPRNLWPKMFPLVRESGIDTWFGEQVASAIRHGWLDGICADLEGAGYAVGHAVFGAHSAGAPHIRQRLYWVANACNPERGRGSESRREHGGALHVADGGGTDRMAVTAATRRPGRENSGAGRSDATADGSRSFELERGLHAGRLADSSSRTGPEHEREPRGGSRREAGPHYSAIGRRTVDGVGNSTNERWDDERDFDDATIGNGVAVGIASADNRLEHAPGHGRVERGTESSRGSVASGCSADGLGNSSGQGLSQRGSVGRVQQSEGRAGEGRAGEGKTAELRSSWSDYAIVHCSDENSRRVGRSVFPLVNGIPRELGRGQPELSKVVRSARSNRVGRLKGYGNAIVVQDGAEFIRAFMELE